MTDPTGDDRDDDYGWDRREPGRGRSDEMGSTAEQLARLRDGLSRGVGRSSARRPASSDSLRTEPSERARRRPPETDEPSSQDHGGAYDLGEPAPGRGLPGSIDRAIDRVGDLFGDLGPSPADEGVRDPYAAPREEEREIRDPYVEDPYDPPYAEEAPRERSRRSMGRPGGEFDEFDAPPPPRDAAFDEPEQDPQPEARRGGRPDRRERRAARAQKADYGYGDQGGYDDPPSFEAGDRGFSAEDPSFSARAFDDPDIGASRGLRAERDPGGSADQEAPLGYLGRGRRGQVEEDRAERRPEPRELRRAEREDRAEEPRARRGRADRAETGRRRGKASRPAMDPAEAAAAARATRGRGAAPFGALERLLAGRYLRARRKEGFISVIAMLSLIGITLAVAVLIVVMSVMNGFRAELIDKIVGVNGHLIVSPIERSFDGYEEVARSIRTVPGVTRAAPLIEGQAFATSARGGVGVMVRGLAKADLLSLEEVSVSPEDSVGSLANYGAGADGVAIGAGLARRLAVTVGDTVNVISPQGSVTPFGVAPKRRAYEILYVFKMGMSNYDDVLMFMPIEDAQTFFNRAGSADFVEVKVATPDRLDGYQEDIEAAAGRPISVTTWQESNGVFIGALETEQSVMFLILSMLILIASLIIVSGLIMLVKEKGPDIAILRTMGLSRGGVMRVFFMCGAAIGVLGAVLGVGLGVIVALNVNDIKEFIEANTGARLFPSEVYLFSNLPSRLDWGDVGFTIMITLGLSFVATLYPAWRAARMDPVEALRYE